MPNNSGQMAQLIKRVVAGVFWLVLTGLRWIGLFAFGFLQHRRLRIVAVLAVFGSLFFFILVAPQYLDPVSLNIGHLIIVGFLLCAAYLSAWLTEEQKRSTIDTDTDAGRVAARKVRDLRSTALISGLAMCFLIPLAYWWFDTANQYFAVGPAEIPFLQDFCDAQTACTFMKAEQVSWLVYCLQLYMTALPILDATDAYGWNFSGVEATQDTARHLAFSTRLVFDFVLLTIIFGGLRDTQQKISIALARLQDTSEPAVRVGQPIIRPLGKRLKVELAETSQNKQVIENGIEALGGVKRREAADMLWDILQGDPDRKLNTDDRVLIGKALASIGAPAARHLKLYVEHEIAQPANNTRPLEAVLPAHLSSPAQQDVDALIKLLKQARNSTISKILLVYLRSISFRQDQKAELRSFLPILHTKLPSTTRDRERRIVQGDATRLMTHISGKSGFFGGWLQLRRA